MNEGVGNVLKRLKQHKKVVSEDVRKRMVVPLPGTFMLTGIVGFLVCFIYTMSGRLDMNWGISFSFVFALMFFASLISMTPPRI